MKPVVRVTNTFIDRSSISIWRNSESLKRLSDEFFTFSPKRLGGVRVERICAHSFAYGTDGHVVRHNLADMAVLAISAADLVIGSNEAGPYRSCGPLWNGLPLESRLALCGKLLIHLVDHLLDLAWVHEATQFGSYASRMHGCRADATLTVPLVESNSEEDIRRFRSAVGNEGS